MSKIPYLLLPAMPWAWYTSFIEEESEAQRELLISTYVYRLKG